MYPLQLRNTYTDGFLVNSVVLLMGSFPALHLAADVLPSFTARTYIRALYTKAADTKLFNPFFDNSIFPWIMIGIAGLTVRMHTHSCVTRPLSIQTT